LAGEAIAVITEWPNENVIKTRRKPVIQEIFDILIQSSEVY
jgi:hypothetical protein